LTESIGAVHAVLTSGCNLRCAYCYQDAKGNQAMDWRTLRRAVDLLLASGRRETTLTFYGGEPLLRFDLVRRAVAYARRKSGGASRPRFAMITNGTLLTDEVADFLALHRVRTRISFDGVRIVQDLRGRGTFPVLDDLLGRLRRRHPGFFRDQVEIASVFSSRTIPHLAESVGYFLRKGVQEILLSPVTTWDAEWEARQIDDLDRQFAELHRISLRHLRRTGEVPLVLFRKDRPDPTRGPAPRTLCEVGRGESLAVDANGEAVACALFAGSFQTLSPFLRSRLEPMRLGSVHDPGLAARLALLPATARAAGIFDHREKKHSAYGRCGRCRFARTCHVCPVAIGRIPGNEDPDRIPDHLCAFNLVSRKWRAKFPVRPRPIHILFESARDTAYRLARWGKIAR
jgi:sulfatase maturation enzyme AslB (radical SAM superfamily)